MSDLNRIVTVNITKETNGLASADFATPLYFSKTATNVVATYTSASEVAEDGYSTTSNEYLASVAHFNQDVYPPNFKIGFYDDAGTASDSLNAIIAVDNDWYGLIPDDSSADIVEFGTWVKANSKFLFTGSGSADMLTDSATDTTSVAFLLNANTIDKSHCIYSGGFRADTTVASFADVAFASVILGKTIGSYTAVNKTLSGIVSDNLTSTQVTNLQAKNATSYEPFYGTNKTFGGRVCDGNIPANGEWLDVEIGVDWLKVRMEESVATTIVNADKIPYSDEGVGILIASAVEPLNTAVKQGLLLEGYNIQGETANSQTVADRTARTYNGITWTAQLAGAIHTTTINGTVRV